MKTPPVLSLNVIQQYKTDWYVTDDEITTLHKNYVFQDRACPAGDINAGCYVGVHREDFANFVNGSKKYRAVLVCENVMQKIRSRK